MDSLNYDIDWMSLKAGNISSLETIYKKYANSLIVYGLKINKDISVVQDNIQDLFIEIWKSRETIAPVNNPQFYLYRALRNKLSKSLLNYKLVDEKYLDLDSESLKTKSVESVILEDEFRIQTKQTITNILAKLPQRQQEIIYLKYYLNFSYEQISQILDMNYQSALNLMQRALKTLRINYVSNNIK